MWRRVKGIMKKCRCKEREMRQDCIMCRRKVNHIIFDKSNIANRVIVVDQKVQLYVKKETKLIPRNISKTCYT